MMNLHVPVGVPSKKSDSIQIRLDMLSREQCLVLLATAFTISSYNYFAQGIVVIGQVLL